MRTERQLREALFSLEAQAPSPDRVMPATTRGRRRPRGRRLLITGVTVAVATAVAVVMITIPARTPARQVPQAVSVRTAILTAFRSASGDIVCDRTWTWAAYAAKAGSTLSMTDWQVPWVIRPGETVHQRFLTPGAPNRPGPFLDEAQTYVQTRGGKAPATGDTVTVNYQDRTWSESPEGVTISDLTDLTTLREQVAKGQFKVVGHPVLNGRRTIELRYAWINHDPGVNAWATTVFWVDMNTYLPIQGVTRTGAIGVSASTRVIRDEYQFLPPTPGNMTQLRAPIPPGFKRVPAVLPDGTKQQLPAGAS